MGRTLPTFNTYLQEEIDSWAGFRRGLRAEQRPALDRLFTRARRHTAEATCAARPVPFDALVMAILLDQELELERLRAEVGRLTAGASGAAGISSSPPPFISGLDGEGCGMPCKADSTSDEGEQAC